tara:strand:- start:36 stop:257 length:222 start_codon:yes stop_codon:yes gene_type:complete
MWHVGFSMPSAARSCAWSSGTAQPGTVGGRRWTAQPSVVVRVSLLLSRWTHSGIGRTTRRNLLLHSPQQRRRY